MTPAFSFRQPPRAEHLVLVQEETEKIKATTDNKKDTLTQDCLTAKHSAPLHGVRHRGYATISRQCLFILYSGNQPTLRF